MKINRHQCVCELRGQVVVSCEVYDVSLVKNGLHYVTIIIIIDTVWMWQYNVAKSLALWRWIDYESDYVNEIRRKTKHLAEFLVTLKINLDIKLTAEKNCLANMQIAKVTTKTKFNIAVKRNVYFVFSFIFGRGWETTTHIQTVESRKYLKLNQHTCKRGRNISNYTKGSWSSEIQSLNK